MSPGGDPSRGHSGSTDRYVKGLFIVLLLLRCVLVLLFLFSLRGFLVILCSAFVAWLFDCCFLEFCCVACELFIKTKKI